MGIPIYMVVTVRHPAGPFALGNVPLEQITSVTEIDLVRQDQIDAAYALHVNPLQYNGLYINVHFYLREPINPLSRWNETQPEPEPEPEPVEKPEPSVWDM
jgi:hypothetical protein